MLVQIFDVSTDIKCMSEGGIHLDRVVYEFYLMPEVISI